MIPENISAALADKADVLEFVKGLDAKAEKFTPELEALLPDIAKLPEYKAHSAAMTKILADTKAETAEKLLTDFQNIKAVNADLLKQKETWKAEGKGKESPEYLQLLEQIEENKKETKAIQDQLKAATEKTTAAETSRRETDLKASVISAAAKHKIRDAEDEFIILKHKGLVGHKEDGTPFYHKLNEKGEKVAVTGADDLMKWIAETNKAKVDASGKTGTGQDHKGGAGGPEAPKTAAEARKAFLHG